MTFLTAVRYGVDAAVVYHGDDTEKYLGEIDGLRAPLLMHLAEEEEFISKPAHAEIKTALAGRLPADLLPRAIPPSQTISLITFAFSTPVSF